MTPRRFPLLAQHTLCLGSPTKAMGGVYLLTDCEGPVGGCGDHHRETDEKEVGAVQGHFIPASIPQPSDMPQSTAKRRDPPE